MEWEIKIDYPDRTDERIETNDINDVGDIVKNKIYNNSKAKISIEPKLVI